MKINFKLNKKEQSVLVSLYNEMMHCTGGEFGYTSDADKCGLNKNEFAGYVSSLQAKSCFEYLQPLEHMKNVAQFALTEEAMELAKSILKTYGDIAENKDLQPLTIKTMKKKSNTVTFDSLMIDANKLYTQSAEEDVIAEGYFKLMKNPTKHVSKAVATDLYKDHKRQAQEYLLQADSLQKQATELINKNTQIPKTMKTVKTAAPIANKVTVGQTRVLSQNVEIGEKTYKAGTKFVIESIKYCVMQIKIGKAIVKANLNLVKSYSSEAIA